MLEENKDHYLALSTLNGEKQEDASEFFQALVQLIQPLSGGNLDDLLTTVTEQKTRCQECLFQSQAKITREIPFIALALLQDERKNSIPELIKPTLRTMLSKTTIMTHAKQKHQPTTRQLYYTLRSTGSFAFNEELEKIIKKLRLHHCSAS